MLRSSTRLGVPCALAALLILGGCDKPPIAWDDPTPIAQPAGATHLVVDRAGHARITIDSLAPASAPEAPGLCQATLGYAPALTRLFAAWWSVRPDSSSTLYIAVSQNAGKTWGPPMAVDTTDVSSVGCTRPPPSLATVGDDVYVAYSMIAPEGKGVFFAHTMGSMLHSPVAVIYGERLVPTAIAADGPRVIVAYEQPNGTRQQVDVALSKTEGHIFEIHTEATRGVDEATMPLVAFDGPTVAVSWLEKTVSSPGGKRVVRIGHIDPTL